MQISIVVYKIRISTFILTIILGSALTHNQLMENLDYNCKNLLHKFGFDQFTSTRSKEIQVNMKLNRFLHNVKNQT